MATDKVINSRQSKKERGVAPVVETPKGEPTLADLVAENARQIKELTATVGAHCTHLDRHDKKLDDHERRIAALEGKASKAPSEAEKEAEKAGSETGKSETSKPETAPKSEPVASPARMSKPGASLPVERRLIEPEEARIIPGCPKDARYEAAYWMCYVQRIVNGENTERSFIMKDKTSAIQKHNSASKRPHKVYVWLDADGEYLGKLNADALLYLHGAE